VSYNKLRYNFDLFCKLCSISFPFGETFFLLGPIWFSAFFGPNMSALVTINECNEAIPEMIMWIVLIPICVYGLYLNVGSILKDDAKRYKFIKTI